MANLWTDHGTFLANNKLSEEIRLQNEAEYVFRPHANPIGGFGANRGEAINFTKHTTIDGVAPTPATEDTWNDEDLALSKDVVTVELYNRRIKFTDKSDTLSQFDLPTQIRKVLADDMRHKIDDLVATEFQTAKFKVNLTGAGTLNFSEPGGAALGAAAANLDIDHVKDIVEIMKKRHIPRNGNFYNCIASIRAARGVYDGLESIAQYADPSFRLASEIGKYIDVVFQEDAQKLSNDLLGTSTDYGEALFFGDESVTEAVAMPEEVRVFQEPGGLKKYVGWVSILGYTKTWDVEDDDSRSVGVGVNGLERIIHVTTV